MTALAFVDTETTGLNLDRHQVWEVAIITAHDTDDGLVLEEEWAAHLPVDLARADPTALRIGRFYERRGQHHNPAPPRTDREFTDTLRQIAVRTANRHMVGAVPSFDAAFLSRLLVDNGLQAAWHYHLVDVEALAAGALQQKPPWNSDDLTARLGVTVPEDERHTALGDARWALRTYQAVLYPTQPEPEPT